MTVTHNDRCDIGLASTVTTTVIVPAGKTIALTYAAMGPTWTGVLL